MFKFFNILKPKILKINLEQKYFNGLYSPRTTGTPYFYWIGHKYIKWLWWKFEIDFKDFEIYNKQVIFKKVLPENTEITFTYYL